MSLLFFKNTSLYHKGICWLIRLALAIITMLYGNVVWAETHSSTPTCTLPISVGDAYIRSFDGNYIESSDSLAEESDNMQAKYEIRPPQLDSATIRRTIFNNILAKSNILHVVQQQMEPILNTHAWADLKLFYGTTTSPGYHFMSRINRTTTVLGEAVLAILLVTPTSSIEHLQSRQYKLRLLLDNPKAAYTLINHLKVYQHVEQSVISFWSKTDPLYTKEYEQYMNNNFYGKNKPLTNKSVRWLEFKKRFFIDFLGIQGRFLYPIMTPIIGEIGFSNYFKADPSARKLAWQKPIPYYGGWKEIQRINLEIDKAKARGLNAEGYKWAYIAPILSEIGWTYMAYSGVKNYLEYSSVLSNLALQMADLQTLIVTASSISKTIAANPDLEAAFGKYLAATRNLLAQAKEQTELGRLIRYLQKLPFNNWSYFFRSCL